jgi:hypothetical protein
MSQNRPADEHHETRLARRVKTVSQISAGAMIPSMILVGIVGGYLLGAWLGRRTGGEVWLGIIGAALGATASVRKIIEMIRSDARSRDDESRGHDPKS